MLGYQTNAIVTDYYPAGLAVIEFGYQGLDLLFPRVIRKACFDTIQYQLPGLIMAHIKCLR